METSNTLLEVGDLKKYFTIGTGIFGKYKKILRAVNGISFNVKKGEILGLVGETGCGKTTAAHTILRILEPTSGEVYFDGKEVFHLKGKELLEFRRKATIIFQDPYASLNPRMTIRDIISEPFVIHGHVRGIEKEKKLLELINEVGLAPYHLPRYPHEFSGGERQRIAIARALAVEPKFVVADEPVSALDISVRAKILNLLKDLQKKFDLTLLFITHDLSVVRHLCDRAAVMYLGKLLETATTEDLFINPRHPYTEALLSAIPIPNPKLARSIKRIILKGDVPTPINPPSGCRFHPRCEHAEPECATLEPELVEMGNRHFVACLKFIR